MTIRTKLLLFIPLLVLLVNSVTFFLFESGKVVQISYDLMMNRILLYKQAAQAADEHLQTLYRYLLHPGEDGKAELDRARAKLLELRTVLSGQSGSSLHASELTGYLHLLETQMEQALAAVLGSAPSRYEETETTTRFIREEGQHLVDLELSSYQPVYRQIQAENGRMNRLGPAIFVVNTLLSIVIAVWISRSITGPVNRLVGMAEQIAKGNLNPDPPPPRSGDELGILSDAFQRMLADLKLLIEKDKERLEMGRLVKELELQALQSQIHPHFLFNTLNALSKLALLEGAEQTSDLIVSMSNLLRYNLRGLDRPVTLRDELGHVQEYVTIQQARFRDRFRFETEIDESALQASVPALTLQPIVENAFVHGIESMEQDAVIRLTIRGEPEHVRLMISDNGRGMSEVVRQSLLRLENENGARARGQTADNKQSTGLGTRNVFKRLRLFFGRSDLVDIDSEPGQGTTVIIRIPHGLNIFREKEG